MKFRNWHLGPLLEKSLGPLVQIGLPQIVVHIFLFSSLAWAFRRTGEESHEVSWFNVLIYGPYGSVNLHFGYKLFLYDLFLGVGVGSGAPSASNLCRRNLSLVPAMVSKSLVELGTY